MITIKTVTPCQKLYFQSKILKAKKKARKLEKETDTNFVLLCQSKNIFGLFKKAYLHRPIRILDFLTPARIQKCLA